MKKKLLVYLGLSLLSLLVVSCNGWRTTPSNVSPNPGPAPSPEDDPNADQHLKINITPDLLLGQLPNQELSIQLGVGVDSRIKFPKINTCLLKMPMTTEAPVSVVYDTPMSYNQIVDILNIGISGNNDIGLFSSSSFSNAMRNTLNTDHSIKFTYGATIKQFSTIYPNNFGINNLNVEAKLLFNNSEKQFYEKCGDSFVYQAQRGGVFLLTLSLSFDSELTKQYFVDYFNLKDNLDNVSNVNSATLLEYISHFALLTKKNVVLEIYARQFGGDLSTLNNLYPNKISCNAENIDQCKFVLGQLEDYRNNYFNSTVNFDNEDELHTFSYLYRSYGSLKIFFKTALPALDNNYLIARTYIENMVNEDRKEYNFLVTYSNQPLMAIVDKDTQDMLNMAILQYKQMINQYNLNIDLLQNCYNDTSSLGQSCYYMMVQMNSIRSNYLDYIKFAKNLANNISLQYSDGSKDILIPVDMQDTCYENGSGSSCYGRYALYKDSKSPGYFNNNVTCIFDNTKDMSYFNSLHLDYLQNKLLYCSYQKGKIYSSYIKRVDTNLTQGISGIVARDNPNVEIDSPVDETGYNVLITK